MGNPANLKPVSGESPDGRLCTRSWRLCLHSSLTADLDVDGVDADQLQFLADVDRSEHSSVGRGLFTIGLDLHAASDARVRLSSRQIGNVNESVVERSLNVADSEDVLRVLAGLGVGRAVVDHLLLLLLIGSSLLLCFGHFRTASSILNNPM